MRAPSLGVTDDAWSAACCFFVDAFAYFFILPQSSLLHSLWGQEMGLATLDMRGRDHATHRGIAMRALGDGHVFNFLKARSARQALAAT